MKNVLDSPRTTALAIVLGVAFIWGETMAPPRFHEPLHQTEALFASAGLLLARDPAKKPE